MKFHVCDTLSGRIVGRLYPNAWSFTDPLATPGTGTLTVPLPDAPAAVGLLGDLTAQRRRWVACEDDQGRFLFGAVIPRRPARGEGVVTVPLVDWRSWFYRAPIRPNEDGSRRNYIKTGSNATEQTTMMADLLELALDTTGAPDMVIDTPPVSGVERERTCLMLDRSVGEYLDGMSSWKVERGAEWHVYVARDLTDPLRLVPHVAISWPERASRSTPIRVEYKDGVGGNAADPSWPEGVETPTRAWAVGDGQPPDQVWATDEVPSIEDGVEVAWEQVLGPLDGVSKKGTAFEYAFRVVEYGQANLQGEAEFTVLDAQIPLGDYATGDRARLIYADGWEDVDLPAARITERTLSGGRGQATQARIKVDLANSDYGDTSTVPGEEVADDGS